MGVGRFVGLNTGDFRQGRRLGDQTRGRGPTAAVGHLDVNLENVDADIVDARAVGGGANVLEM
jgi:hypothetical protein